MGLVQQTTQLLSHKLKPSTWSLLNNCAATIGSHSAWSPDSTGAYMISSRTNQLCEGTRGLRCVDLGDFDCPTVNMTEPLAFQARLFKFANRKRARRPKFPSNSSNHVCTLIISQFLSCRRLQLKQMNLLGIRLST